MNESTAHIGIIHGEKQRDILLPFSKIATQNQISIACFTAANIDTTSMSGTAQVFYGTDSSNTVPMPLPPFLFNVTVHQKRSSICTIRQLRTDKNHLLVNPTNRFNQAVLFDILRAFPQSQQFLSPFLSLSEHNLQQFLQPGGELLLLPERGLTPGRAVRLRKERDTITVYSGIYQQPCTEAGLYSTLLKMTSGKSYMMLQSTALILWNQLPLEARVYVQKDACGTWTVTGNVGKTDIFAFGSVHREEKDDLRTLLSRLDPPNARDLYKRVCDLAVTLASYLEYYINGVGFLSFDFVFSKAGSPYLFSIQGFEQSFPFPVVKSICCETAVQYLLYLYGKQHFSQP